MKKDLYIGSYTKDTDKGIYHVEADIKTGALVLKKTFGGAVNPSWVLLSGDKRILYCVEELTPGGRAACFLTGITGDAGKGKGEKGGDNESGFTFLNRLSTDGDDPCHLTIDPSGQYLFAANYTSGSLAVFRLADDGSLLEMTDFVQHEGHSVDPDRQAGAHVHFTKFIGGKLFSCDLGEDTVYCYDFSPESGKLTQDALTFRVPEGYGPRHLTAAESRPELIYVFCELAAKVLVYRLSDGAYRLMQELDTIPAGVDRGVLTVGTKASFGAAIRLTQDEKYLMTSTRGYNSIAVFRILEDGLLELTDMAPSLGRTPRDFNIIGDYVLCANQDENLVTVLSFNPESGTLSPAGQSLVIPSPTCICY